MEDDYIRLSKWDLERIVGSMGGVSAYDRQYYKYDTRIEGAHGYNRNCICIFYDASADEPIFYSIRYSYDEYTDEITIHEVGAITEIVLSLTTGCFLLDPDRSPNTINLHGVPPK